MAETKKRKQKQNKDEAAVQQSPSASPSRNSKAKTPFNDKIDIFYENRLPVYDRGPIKAYHAAGRNEAPEQLIAYVCEPDIMPRWDSAGKYSGVANSTVAHLIACGAALWPPDNAERYMFIYKNNFGQPLLGPDDKQAMGLKPDIVLENVIRPMAGVFRDFKERGFVHGNINIYNFYDGGGQRATFQNLVLGDGLSAPHSYTQPQIYEPIERGMADPKGRGPAMHKDDMYAFGVSLVIMMRHGNPLAKLNEREIIHEKLDKGTYAALVGQERFTGAMLELLRGLLHDDPAERWSIDDLLEWLDGRRLTPKQATRRKKAARTLYLEEDRYLRPEMLAMNLHVHSARIESYIEDRKIDQWLSRSLSDPQAAERLEEAVLSAKELGQSDQYKDRLLSRISIALDPSAPIRYKGLVFRPEGLGEALAEAYVHGDNLNPFAEIIQQNLIMFWLNSLKDNSVDIGMVMSTFESCRVFLRNTNMGYGLERCLYFLHPEAPCLSEKLKNHFVKTPDELLLAFENMLENGTQMELFLDRHIVAFLSARDSKVLDACLIEINSSEHFKKVMGNVWALSNIQKRYEMPPLPHVASHIVGLLDPVLKRFHDRELRDRIKKEFSKIKKSGDLGELIAILNNVEIIDKDLRAFQNKITEYHFLEQEKKELQTKLDSKANFGLETGRSIAAIISALAGGVIIIILAFVEMFKMGA